MTYDLNALLKENAYPGRGIVLGRAADGAMRIAYFIMGRSENSRNRVFVTDGEGIRTQAFDPAKLEDPSLIIYAPVRVLGKWTIVTNGDQTDTVFDGLKAGLGFAQSLQRRTFEPDAPNYTPRISGLVTTERDSFHYALNILKSADGDPAECRRYTFEYPTPIKGLGHFLHTYQCDGNPIPSFSGEPEQVKIEGDFNTFAQNIWDSLNPDNKVSLFVREIAEDGKVQTRIFNKHC